MTTVNKKTFPSWLEWEVLQEEVVIEKPNIKSQLPGTPHLLKIWRNDEYKIEAEISGHPGPEAYSLDAEKQDDVGKVIYSSVIKGITQAKEDYELTGLISGDVLVQHKNIGTGRAQESFTASLTLHQIKIIQQQNVPVKWLTEWYINGIESGFKLFRSTSREFSETYLREREVQKEKVEHFNVGRTRSKSRDYALINCEEFSFIIHSVPSEFGPKWSKNIGIEYRQEFGKIPTSEERVAISEIVSFVIGKHLLNVGYTSYDISGIPIEKVANNPWGDNIRSLCHSPPISPFEFDRLVPTNKIETVLPPLIKKYLESRESLKLNDVLWKYWIGIELPLGSNIPIMANGIEILAKYWFKSQRSKSKGVYLAKEEYDRITTEDFERIAEKIAETTYKEKIMNKLKDCYNMSLTDKLKFFFEEIDLPLGTTEEEAIRCRHKMIHSSVEMGDDKIEKILRLSNAYRCLIHRTILKILGYSGTYTDYSLIGLPEKPINCPTGEKT